MPRYEKYNYILSSLQISKFSIFNKKEITTIKTISAQAGHFKLNAFYGEHSLLLSSLAGKLPKINLFKHGKRQKNTVLLTAKVTNNLKWFTIDKFLNEWFPSTSDININKQKNTKTLTNFYSLRIRNVFELDEANVIVTERIIKRNIYLPIFLNILLSKKNKVNNKVYLRMLRLPFIN
jgi:hypothetical protein